MSTPAKNKGRENRQFFPRCIVSKPGTMVESTIVALQHKNGGGAVLYPQLSEVTSGKSIDLWRVSKQLIKELFKRGFKCKKLQFVEVRGYKRKAYRHRTQTVRVYDVTSALNFCDPT